MAYLCGMKRKNPKSFRLEVADTQTQRAELLKVARQGTQA